MFFFLKVNAGEKCEEERKFFVIFFSAEVKELAHGPPNIFFINKKFGNKEKQFNVVWISLDDEMCAGWVLDEKTGVLFLSVKHT